jgi:hypothetical protein
MVPDTRAIPFQQSEFRVVPGTSFPVAKSFANLEDGFTVGGQQALHCIFRRCLQVSRPAQGDTLLNHQWLYRRIGDAAVTQQRRFDFKDATLSEKLAKLAQQCPPRPDLANTRGRLPVH